MRKFTLLFFMMLSVTVLTMAQTIEDFESIKMNLFSGGTNGAISVVPNPDPTGANTTGYVGKMVRGFNGDPWQGWYSPQAAAIDVVANPYVHIKVWKPRISPTCFKYENGTAANSGDVFPIAEHTLTGQWEEVVFDFTVKAAGSYNQIVLIPDFESPLTLTEDIVLYFDEIYINNDPTVGSAPVQILENFEPIAMNYMGGGAEDLSTLSVIANPDKSGVNLSDAVVEFKRDKDGVPWGGFWSATPVDVTTNKFVHVKVWKNRISPVKFKIEGGTDGTFEIPSKYPQTLVGQWEDMVFDCRTHTGTYPVIAFMPDFEDPLTLTEDDVIYFDDIRINNDSTSLLPPVQVFNIDMTKSGLTPGQNVWISGTLGGIYGSWAEPSTNPNNQMFDRDGDGIYTITVSLVDGPISFKFFKGDNWNNGDNVAGDRPYTVAGSAVINLKWGVKGEVTPMVHAPTTNSVKATAAVVIDGLLTDADWATARKYELTRVFKGETIDGPEDCSAFFQTVWADSGVFVAVTVTDDILGVTAGGKYGPDWNQDLVEVYFDMNTFGLRDGKGPSAASSGHYQSADRAVDGTVGTTGIKYTYLHTGNNGDYVKELYFPWKSLKDVNGKIYTPNANVPLGFDVYIADNDTAQADAALSFRNRLVWSNTGTINEDYANMDDAGRMVFIDAPADFVPQEATSVKAKKAVVIDGALTESDWTTSKKYDIARVFKGENIDGPTDCSGFFQTLWADSGIFVAVTVTDDILGVTAGNVYGPDWNQDLVEVYFDMNVGNLKDGKGPSVGKGHYQNANAFKNDTIVKSSTFVYAYKHGTNGNYVKELFVPWTVLKDSTGALFTDNTLPIGFDVYIADNDTSQADKAVSFRNRLVWSNIGTVNESYANMNDAGYLYISGIPQIFPVSVETVNVRNLTFYPNPANEYITIRTSSTDLLPVVVTNITGQTVLSTTVSDNAQLDISRLERGIYFIKVSDKNQIFTGKLVKK